MSMDWEKIEKSKREERTRLADLPIGDKFRILDQMRGRAAAIKAPKKPTNKKDQAARKKD